MIEYMYFYSNIVIYIQYYERNCSFSRITRYNECASTMCFDSMLKAVYLVLMVYKK